MLQRRIVFTLTTITLAILLLPSFAVAVPYHGVKDNLGSFSLGFDESSTAGVERISFAFTPPTQAEGTQVTGSCLRSDGTATVGSNKVIFLRGSVTGVDSGKKVKLRRQRQKMEEGRTGSVEWEFPGELAGEQSAVLEMNVKVKKKFDAGDRLTCRLAIHQSVSGNAADGGLFDLDDVPVDGSAVNVWPERVQRADILLTNFVGRIPFGTERLAFVANPAKFDELRIVALCGRYSGFGNTVRFTNGAVTGLDSGIEASLAARSAKLKKNRRTISTAWEFPTDLAEERAVLLEVDVSVSRKITPNDSISCGLIVEPPFPEAGR